MDNAPMSNYYTVDGVSANVGGTTGVNMFVGSCGQWSTSCVDRAGDYTGLGLRG